MVIREKYPAKLPETSESLMMTIHSLDYVCQTEDFLFQFRCSLLCRCMQDTESSWTHVWDMILKW